MKIILNSNPHFKPISNILKSVLRVFNAKKSGKLYLKPIYLGYTDIEPLKDNLKYPLWDLGELNI